MNNSRYKNIAQEVKDRARFAHLRNYERVYDAKTHELVQSPGATIAFIDIDDKYYAGVAYCNPLDNFNKSMGRVKARGRLVQLLGDTFRPEDAEYLYFEGDSTTHTDYDDFKAAVIGTVSFRNNYPVLPGKKKGA